MADQKQTKAEKLKKEWIWAYDQTRLAYANFWHRCAARQCKKCNISEINYISGIISSVNCHLCLENRHFLNEEINFVGEYPCMDRLNRPDSSENMVEEGSIGFGKRGRLIMYHEKAIAYLETVLPITFEKHREVIVKHLMEIDKQVYEINIGE